MMDGRMANDRTLLGTITVLKDLRMSVAIFTGRDIAGPHWLIKETGATYRCL
jgi:hypothetical protein